MPTRDFNAWVAENRGESFVDFPLGSSVFHVRNPIPAYPVLVIMGKERVGLPEWTEYLAGMLVEPVDELMRAVSDSGIDVAGIMEICHWIVEASTERPTSPSSLSRRRSSTNGHRGKVASSKPASTRRTPPSVAS